MQAAAGLPSILIVLPRLSDFSAQALLSKWDVELNLRHVQHPSDSLLLKRASSPGSSLSPHSLPTFKAEH